MFDSCVLDSLKWTIEGDSIEQRRGESLNRQRYVWNNIRMPVVTDDW